MIPDSRGPSVLVVDDDPAARELLADVFRRVGYVVEQASSGVEALETIGRRPPAVVLLDVHMPGLSGYEVLREVKEASKGEIPVVFVSGERTEPYDRAAGILLGADDYVVKPFDADELLARIQRLIRKHSNSRRMDERLARAGLTAREREILALLAEGRNQREIADALVISPKTVATHIQRILSKLNVHSRAQAVAHAHIAGLLGL